MTKPIYYIHDYWKSKKYWYCEIRNIENDSILTTIRLDLIPIQEIKLISNFDKVYEVIYG